MTSSLRVMFLAAEADPFIKIGGLGDVAGSLPPALRRLPRVSRVEGNPEEIDIRLVIPFHGAIQRQAFPVRSIASFTIQQASGPVRAEALSLEVDGLPVYFIAGSLIPPDAPVYTADASVDGLKFTFFSLAALELARALNWVPHIVHANDWHTAPAIYALNLGRQQGSFYYSTSTLLGLHNLPYLGVGAGPALVSFGLPPAINSALPEWAQSMPLPLGLLSADHVVAASPSYAQEILTPEFGSGLYEFLRLRSDSISGILNGIDIQRWDPAHDTALASNFSHEDLAARLANKVTLQNELGLDPDPSRPLLAMVTRMDYQKGVDLVPDALRELARLPDLLGQSWQAVILGTGDPALEAAVRHLEFDFSGRVRAAIRFDAALSHRIYAGADMLLIPSRYEPCGLTQMIAMRYGCVPVARATGGLNDTIQDYSRTMDSTGFLFSEPTSTALAAALGRALRVFADQREWSGLQRRGMLRDFSWERSAGQYLDLYSSLVNNRLRQLSQP